MTLKHTESGSLVSIRHIPKEPNLWTCRVGPYISLAQGYVETRTIRGEADEANLHIHSSVNTKWGKRVELQAILRPRRDLFGEKAKYVILRNADEF